MAYVINYDCISCEINADVCVDCGACAGTCPVGAPNPQ